MRQDRVSSAFVCDCHHSQIAMLCVRAACVSRVSVSSFKACMHQQLSHLAMPRPARTVGQDALLGRHLPSSCCCVSLRRCTCWVRA